MTSNRPNPLGEVASKVGTAWSVGSGLVGALVTYGFLSTAQADAITAAGDAMPSTITAVGTAIAGIVPLIGGVVASFRTASAGRDHVTPVSAPQDNEGNKLTPDAPPEPTQPAPSPSPTAPYPVPSYPAPTYPPPTQGYGGYGNY